MSMPNTNLSDLSKMKGEYAELDRAILDVQLEEYRTLRTESLNRVGSQIQLTNFLVILIAAILTISGYILDKQLYNVFLMIPLVFIPLCWLFLREDTMLLTVTLYLNTDLIPSIRANLGEINSHLLYWEIYRSKTHFELSKWENAFHRFLAFTRYLLALAPSIFALVAFVIYMRGYIWRFEESILFAFDCGLIIFTLYLTIKWITQRSLHLRTN